MKIQRCPECGMRLTSNYCDVCMRRVPFRGIRFDPDREAADASSAHREERGHECVSFDDPWKKQKKTHIDTRVFVARTMAIVGMLIVAVNVLHGLVNEVVEDLVPENEYGAYVEDADVPQIVPAELYNDGSIVITADSSGLYYDDYTISLTLQNYSEQDVTVSAEQISVNGYMLSSTLIETVEAGKSQQALMTFPDYRLEDADITQVAEIAFYLEIYDSDSYDDIANTGLITLYTDAAGNYEQVTDDSGWEMYCGGDVRILVRDMEVFSYGSCNLELFMENLSDYTVSVDSETIKVNGQAVSGYTYNTLRSGTLAVSSINIYDMPEQEITAADQIREITVELTIEYMEDWYPVETVSRTITFTPEDLAPYIS